MVQLHRCILVFRAAAIAISSLVMLAASNECYLITMVLSLHCRVDVEVLKEWEVSFNALLKNPDGIDIFEFFLKSEFSEENIQFWKACEKYKVVPDHQMEKEAATVYDEFLAPQAPKLVSSLGRKGF